MEVFRVIFYLIRQWQFIFITLVSIASIWVIVSLTSLAKKRGPRKKKIKLIQKKKKGKQEALDEDGDEEGEDADDEERPREEE